MFARSLLLFLFMASPQTAEAQVAVAVADSGDTGWIILCALLVLLAALPGLLLRHAGVVNVRSALSISAQTVAVAAGVSLAWAIAGYSLAFAPGNIWLGGGSNLLLANLGSLRDGLTVPESAFVLFQMALALFAACLLPGAAAERARFGWVVALAPLWLLIVYAPLAHAIWGGGWLSGLGVIDFAGGLVIHMSAGFSALALSLILGRRRNPVGASHAPVLSLAGGALMWRLAGQVFPAAGLWARPTTRPRRSSTHISLPVRALWHGPWRIASPSDAQTPLAHYRAQLLAL
jgi:ammonium transporter, Amt family